MIDQIRELRNCLGCFTTGVTVITSIYNGAPVGVTVNSFNSVSLTPPLILFSLDKKSSRYNPFMESTHFCVNILSEQQKYLSQQFALLSETMWNKVEYIPGEATGSPVLAGIVAFLECSKTAMVDGGDHTIILGEVMNFAIRSEAAPLVYYKGDYHHLGKVVMHNVETDSI